MEKVLRPTSLIDNTCKESERALHIPCIHMPKLLLLLLYVLVFIESCQSSAVLIEEDDPPPILTGRYTDSKSRPEESEPNLLLDSMKNFTQLNQKYITNCVNITDFKMGRESFINYIFRLQACDAHLGTSQLQEACNNRLFDITTFHKIVYIHFCDPLIYDEICEPEHGTDEEEGSGDFNVHSHHEESGHQDHDEVIRKAKAIRDSEDSFLIDNACRNIDDYFAELNQFQTKLKEFQPLRISYVTDGHRDHKIPFIDFAYQVLSLNDSYIVPAADYQEWFVPVVPFCKPYMCVASRQAYDEGHVSSYSCMPSNCRAVVIIVMVLDGLLAVVTVIANSLVLAVAARTKIMRNIPGYFKISLAVADFIVGAFVLPGSIYNAYVFYIQPLPWREPGEIPHQTDYFARSYLNFMGFFTIFPICISLYTMGAASLDRYLAITKPFKYRQGKYLTKKRCIGVFTAIWLFGLIFALFPIVTKEEYVSTAFTLFMSTGIASAIVYVVGLGVPLIAVWSFNTAMLKNVCAGGEKRRSIRVARPPNINNNNFGPYSADDGNMTVITNNNHSVDKIIDEEDEVEESSNGGSSRKTSISSSATNINYYRKDPTVPSVSAKITKDQKNRRQSLFNVSMTFVQAHIHSTNGQRTQGRPQTSALEKRLARTLAIMIGAFSVALVPCIVVLLVGALIIKRITPSVWPEEYSTTAAVAIASSLYVASRLILSNSFWNCIIYSIRNRHFRRAMFAVFLCSRRKIDRHLRSSISVSSQWKRRSGYGPASFSHGPGRHPVLVKAHSASSARSVASAPGHGYQTSRRSTGMWSLSTYQSSRYNSHSNINNNPNPNLLRVPVTKTISLPDMTTRRERHEENEVDRIRRSSEASRQIRTNIDGHRKLEGTHSIERIEEE